MEKNFPRASPFSLVSGGYLLGSNQLRAYEKRNTYKGTNQEMSAGLPSKKSGMKTLYVWSLSEEDRISAPWMDWGKYPKMSKTKRRALDALAGPVTS